MQSHLINPSKLLTETLGPLNEGQVIGYDNGEFIMYSTVYQVFDQRETMIHEVLVRHKNWIQFLVLIKEFFDVDN